MISPQSSLSQINSVRIEMCGASNSLWIYSKIIVIFLATTLQTSQSYTIYILYNSMNLCIEKKSDSQLNIKAGIRLRKITAKRACVIHDVK